jgi:hypothetical protein
MSGVLQPIFPTDYGADPQLDATRTDGIAGHVSGEYCGLLVLIAVWLVRLALPFVRWRIDRRVFMGGRRWPTISREWRT